MSQSKILAQEKDMTRFLEVIVMGFGDLTKLQDTDIAKFFVFCFFSFLVSFASHGNESLWKPVGEYQRRT